MAPEPAPASAPATPAPTATAAPPTAARPPTTAIPPAPTMSARLPAHPELVLCRECKHNSHHIRYFRCALCHLYPVSMYPRVRDPNGIYYD
jgi:ribosomal protein L37E